MAVVDMEGDQGEVEDLKERCIIRHRGTELSNVVPTAVLAPEYPLERNRATSVLIA